MSAELVALQEKYVENISQFKQLLAEGQISQSEYDELVQDVLESDNILKELQKQDLAIDVAKFIEGVKLAASLL